MIYSPVSMNKDDQLQIKQLKQHGPKTVAIDQYFKGFGERQVKSVGGVRKVERSRYESSTVVREIK